jgi:hypothetical protein
VWDFEKNEVILYLIQIIDEKPFWIMIMIPVMCAMMVLISTGLHNKKYSLTKKIDAPL